MQLLSHSRFHQGLSFLPAARGILEKWVESDHRYRTLQAVQTIEYMREESRPFAPALHRLLALISKRPKLPPGVSGAIDQWADQVTLHFLQGAPLYYKALAKWTSRAHMEPDPSVHF